MSLKDSLKALFSSAGVPDTEIDAHFSAADFAPAVSPGMTDGEKALFSRQTDEIKALRAESIRKDAEAYADASIRSSKAYPAERTNLISAFAQAAQDDAAAPTTVSFSSGSEAKTGSRLDAFRALVDSRPAHGLTSEEVRAAAFNGGTLLPARSETDEADKINAQVEKLLASTDIGRKIAADKAKK